MKCEHCGKDTRITQHICYRNVSFVQSKNVKRVDAGRLKIIDKFTDFIKQKGIGDIIVVKEVVSHLNLLEDTGGDTYRNRLNYLVCRGILEKIKNNKKYDEWVKVREFGTEEGICEFIKLGKKNKECMYNWGVSELNVIENQDDEI